jgi:AcrR family transcriptional regulator
MSVTEFQRDANARRVRGVRNREHVLAVAEQVFARQGPSATIGEIADRAGLGVATIYRNYPTKDVLLDAVTAGRLRALAMRARARAAEDDPARVLFDLLEQIAGECAASTVVSKALVAAVGHRAETAAARVALVDALGVLVARAQERGAVRGDVTAEQALVLVAATCAATPGDNGDALPFAPLLAIVRDGLRRPAVEPYSP